MLYKWTIEEVTKEDELITHAKYRVVATDEVNSVETEGNWYFSDKTVKKPYNEVKEEDIASWIEQEATINGECHIKSNLDKQLLLLKNNKKAVLPWLPQVFTPDLG